jgi:DNA-3-methyladenine glycosylase
VDVAQELLGLVLVRKDASGQRRAGVIVETEAYQGPEDRAAHSAGGRRTARTDVMYGPAGHAYVYQIYGIHFCVNVVCAAVDVPHAVLVRALEPVEGALAKTSGPGLVCKALAIDRAQNSADLVRGDVLWIERPRQPRVVQVACTTRVGVEYAGEWALKPWRFYDADSPFVSRRPRGAARAPRVRKHPAPLRRSTVRPA